MVKSNDIVKKARSMYRDKNIYMSLKVPSLHSSRIMISEISFHTLDMNAKEIALDKTP
jgi:hypothetical protein